MTTPQQAFAALRACAMFVMEEFVRAAEERDPERLKALAVLLHHYQPFAVDEFEALLFGEARLIGKADYLVLVPHERIDAVMEVLKPPGGPPVTWPLDRPEFQRVWYRMLARREGLPGDPVASAGRPGPPEADVLEVPHDREAHPVLDDERAVGLVKALVKAVHAEHRRNADVPWYDGRWYDHCGHPLCLEATKFINGLGA